MIETTTPQAHDPLPDRTVDAVVIGGGPAGLAGALMLARSRRRVVVLDVGRPRNAPAAAMHGFPVLDGMSPAEILARSRAQVRGYGGLITEGQVAAAAPAPAAADGDLRFRVALSDGRAVTARRLLVATGLTDVLPEIPGLATHFGDAVVHCPYCHGFEVRDRPIGVLATGPGSPAHALLFRQLTDDLIYFTDGHPLSAQDRARFTARGVDVVDTPVEAIAEDASGALAGLRLAGGGVVPRRVIAVATAMRARTDGLAGLGLPTEELPGGTGRRLVAGMAGTTEVPGVWVAGNATDLTAQVGASAAAGALAGAHINAVLAAADADAAVAAAG